MVQNLNARQHLPQNIFTPWKMLTLAFFLTNELVQDLFKDNKIYFTYIILH